MIPNHGEFLSQQFGGRNWVVARRTANIVSRYGEDVICVNKKQMRSAELEWRRLYGDPYDKERAAMYCALIAIKAHLEAKDECRALMIATAAAAIEAELARL